MSNKRKVEVFSAGCSLCKDTVRLVNELKCTSCEVKVLDMNDKGVASRAKKLGINSVPAVVVDGRLATCCEGRGPAKLTLQAAGIGKPK